MAQIDWYLNEDDEDNSAIYVVTDEKGKFLRAE
jgi:hypothetical protein